MISGSLEMLQVLVTPIELLIEFCETQKKMFWILIWIILPSADSVLVFISV